MAAATQICIAGRLFSHLYELVGYFISILVQSYLADISFKRLAFNRLL